MKNAWCLWLAQGGGIGRLPVAPGTGASVLGLVWTWLLLAAGDWRVFALGCGAGVALAVPVCGAAARRLNHPDPGSVVLDEIAAVPLCFAAWLVVHAFHAGRGLRAAELFSGGGALLTLATLAAFRFFDVLKPWPVRQSQALPGGWGIVLDDVLAAGYVNLVLGPVLAGWWWFGDR